MNGKNMISLKFIGGALALILSIIIFITLYEKQVMQGINNEINLADTSCLVNDCEKCSPNSETKCTVCKKGYYLENDICVACGINGVYCADGINQSTCPQYYKNSDNNSVAINGCYFKTIYGGDGYFIPYPTGSPQKCPAGTYANDENVHYGSSNSCKKCPPNTYSDTIGAAGVSTCRSCGSNKVSPAGSTSESQCINGVRVSSVSVNETSVNLKVGNTTTIIATINPNNASNKKLTWSSSKRQVATVDVNGKITAVGVGTATITVTTEDGEKKATVSVTVTENTSTCNVINCDICVTNDATKCLTCKTGYHVTSDKKCEADSNTTCNVDNCKTCTTDDNNKCAICNSGYHLSNGKCLEDITSCPEGQGINSFGTCQNCADGYWSENGSISCPTKCPAGFACKNGRKVKCETQTPEGSSECPTCEVKNCKSCEDGKIDVCKKCNDGYYVTSSGKCGYSGGGRTTPSNACYKNTANNQYYYGEYSSTAGYSKVIANESNCNKIILKIVDDKGVDLQGATIEYTPISDSTKKVTYTIGTKEIELINSGTYSIKETSAPSNYQADTTNISLTISAQGIISVTGSSNLDFKNTNNSRNVMIVWKNNLNGNALENEKECYIKKDTNNENVYCYGNEDTCKDFTDKLDGRDEKSCSEEIACYKNSLEEYVLGKYNGRDDYTYYSATCPSCYKNKNGDLSWGSFEGIDGYFKASDIPRNECITKIKDDGQDNGESKLPYIILIILIIIMMICIFLKLKGKNAKKTPKEEEEPEDYNYRI